VTCLVTIHRGIKVFKEGEIMLQRNFLVAGFLVLFMSALFSRDSFAGVSLTGFSFNWGSIDCASVLKGLAKKDAPNTTVGCNVNINEASLQCVNKGGNADPSNAEKFQPSDEPIVGVNVSANSCKLDKVTGRWFCNESISNTALESALGISPDSPIGLQCGPNRNFHFKLDVITKMCAQVIVVDADGFLADQGFASCSLSPGSPAGTPFSCNPITEDQFNSCPSSLFP
jgi:hypothetical protein